VLTGFIPRKPHFVSWVKRHGFKNKELNSGKPRLARRGVSL